MKKDKFIYIVDDNPLLLLVKKSGYNDFKEILKEYKNGDKLDFIKKYSRILKLNVNRDWVLNHSIIIKRRYNLTGLGTFENEESFYFEEYDKVIKWADSLKESDKVENAEYLDSFLEYVFFYKCNGIELPTWYIKPEFNYYIKFYNLLLPNSYRYLLSQDFIDGNKNLSFINVFDEEIPDIQNEISNDTINDFDFEFKKQYYVFNDNFINNIISEMELNYKNIEEIADKEEKQIINDDYCEFLKILKETKDNELMLLTVIQ